MTPRSLTIITLVLGLLATGAAPAFADGGPWYGGEGQYEPSTTYDTPEFMQQYANNGNHPDGVQERIYFNGFILNNGQGANLEGGSIMSSFSTFAAMLGYWRDCNGDGYIGAKNAPTPYGNWNTGSYPRDAVAIDESICPAGSFYNRYSFVDEFRWIGPNAAPTDAEVRAQGECNPADWTTIMAWCTKQWRDPTDVNDYNAKVWGDFNRPDARAARTGSFTPGYMHQNSSGTLEYVNWFTGISSLDGFTIERDVDGDGEPDVSQEVIPAGTWDGKPNFGHCEAGSAEFLGGDAFLNVTGTCGLYPLWQTNRLQNDSRSEDERATPIATVYDTEEDSDGSGSACDDTALPTGQQMADVEPSVHENPLMRGSIGGTRQNIEEGTGNRNFDGECGAPDPNSSGSDEEPVDGKNSVDAQFYFAPDKRLQIAKSLGVEYIPADTLGITGGPAAPAPWGGDYILFATSSGPRWLGTPEYVTIGPPRGYDGPSFATFYADVTTGAFANSNTSARADTALPAGVQNAHTYGQLQCNGNFADTPENKQPNVEFGWVCSTEEWIPEDETGVLYYVGMPYDFRDVDCYDATVMAGLEWNDVNNAEGDTIRQSCEEWRVNAGPGIPTP